MPFRQRLLNAFLLPSPFDRQWTPEVLHRADFICPQAFGRNAYSDKEVGAIVNTAREKLCHDDIATFEWLKSQKFDPGLPNVLLADMCFGLSDALDKPIFGQWEVMYEIYLDHPGWYENRKDRLIAIWPPTEGYLATRGLFLEARRIVDEKLRTLDDEGWWLHDEGWWLPTPLLVAHPEHIQRCFFLGEKVFSTTPAIATLAVSDGWFDPKSVQWWTRGKWHWLFYELCLARPHHWLKGWF